MRNKVILISLFLLSSLVLTNYTFASTTNGTIDSSYHYAWGENVGFVDFINVTVTDSVLGSSIYGENIGWIDLSTITNDNEGNLSGSAWGENIGWVDFSKTIIGTDGIFTGGAYGENIGWITFGTTTNKVMTDWRPASTRTTSTTSTTSSGSTLASRNRFLAQNNPPVIPSSPNTCPNGNTIESNCTTKIPTERTLKLGMTGNDVKDLQIYLNTHNYVLTTLGPGSPNNETTFFGKLTKQAVIKFQKANNLVPDGIVGPLTKLKLK